MWSGDSANRLFMNSLGGFNGRCTDCNNAVTQARDTVSIEPVNRKDGEKCMKRIAGIFLAALVVASVASAGALLVNGAGATFPNPIYSKWFDEYHKQNGNIEINYQSVGSGAGIKQVTDGTVDFGASDGPMNDEQLKPFQYQHIFALLHFPTYLFPPLPPHTFP